MSLRKVTEDVVFFLVCIEVTQKREKLTSINGPPSEFVKLAFFFFPLRGNYLLFQLYSERELVMGAMVVLQFQGSHGFSK